MRSFGYSALDSAWIVSIDGFGVFGGSWVWSWFLQRIGLYRTMIAFAVIYAASIGMFTLQESYAGHCGGGRRRSSPRPSST